MNPQERCLIAVDLDDTALHELRSLNPVTLAVLREARGRGHRVMIATARPSCLTMNHYRALGLDTPLCLSNGADYYLPGNPEFPDSRDYIPRERLRELIQLFPQDSVCGVWMENDDELRVSGGWTGDGSPYFCEVYNLSRVRALWPEKLPSEGAGRLFLWVKAFAGEERLLERMRAVPGVGAKCRPWRAGSGIRVYSAWSVFADKWFCVEKTAAYYDISRENIIAFGDDTNDRGMVRNAACGFAMLNGVEVLKKEAPRVTRWTNQEGGVGRELNELLELDMDLDALPVP